MVRSPPPGGSTTPPGAGMDVNVLHCHLLLAVALWAAISCAAIMASNSSFGPMPISATVRLVERHTARQLCDPISNLAEGNPVTVFPFAHPKLDEPVMTPLLRSVGVGYERPCAARCRGHRGHPHSTCTGRERRRAAGMQAPHSGISLARRQLALAHAHQGRRLRFEKISYGWLFAARPSIEQLFEGQPEERLIHPFGAHPQAGGDSVAISRIMFGGTTNSDLSAAAADHYRNEIVENAAGEHAHEELNRW